MKFRTTLEVCMEGVEVESVDDLSKIEEDVREMFATGPLAKLSPEPISVEISELVQSVD